MTTRELTEYAKLSKRWAKGKATKREILRCMELDRRKRAYDNLSLNIETLVNRF